MWSVRDVPQNFVLITARLVGRIGVVGDAVVGEGDAAVFVGVDVMVVDLVGDTVDDSVVGCPVVTSVMTGLF